MLATVRAGEHDVVIADPPRGGLSWTCLQELLRTAPGRLLYVSCDAATLARDLGQLCRGGYRIVRIQPFDIFPQTGHLETSADLVR